MYTVKPIGEKKKLWTCPRCKRRFERRGQTHSCRAYPLAQHFEHKPLGKILYAKLKSTVKKETGNFKVESLECCIHFVSTYTFAAVKIFRDKIRVHFSLDRRITNNRISQSTSMSAHRYLHCVAVQHEEDIDEELLEWIHEAHDKKAYKPSDSHDNE